MDCGKVKRCSASLPPQIVVCLLAIVTGGMLLRVWARAGQTLWFDEAFSWRLAAYPWGELLRRAALDNNPPLYYLLLKGWMMLAGESALALSLLSIVLSGLACAGMFAFVLEAYGRATCERESPLDKPGVRWLALFAAALLATSGFQIRWGTQVRMYALLAALAIASSWLLLRAMHARGRALDRWLAYALTTLLLAYSHTYGLFTIGAQAIYVAGSLLTEARGRSLASSMLGRRRGGWGRSWPQKMTRFEFGLPASDAPDAPPPGHRRGKVCLPKPRPRAALPQPPAFASDQPMVETSLARPRRLPGAMLAAAVFAAGWLPWLPVLLRQQAQVRGDFWLPPLTWWHVRHAWHMLTAGPSLGGARAIHSAVGIVCLLGVVLLFWRPRPADRLVFLAAVVPLTAGILLSVMDRNILAPRYLAAAQPFVLLAAARLLLVLRNLRWRTIVAALVVVLSVVFNRDLPLRERTAPPSGIHAAAQYVDVTRSEAAPVIGTCPLVFLPLIYHLRGSARGHLFTDGIPIPHFEGRAVFKDEELLTARALKRLRSPQVFVVSNACHLGQQTGEVEVPETWRLVRQAEFQETYGIPVRVTVAEYRTD